VRACSSTARLGRRGGDLAFSFQVPFWVKIPLDVHHPSPPDEVDWVLRLAEGIGPAFDLCICRANWTDTTVPVSASLRINS
jgi:hypothetical protein